MAEIWGELLSFLIFCKPSNCRLECLLQCQLRNINDRTAWGERGDQCLSFGWISGLLMDSRSGYSANALLWDHPPAPSKNDAKGHGIIPRWQNIRRGRVPDCCEHGSRMLTFLGPKLGQPRGNCPYPIRESLRSAAIRFYLQKSI